MYELLSESAKEQRRAYQREYRAKHKDKIREYNARAYQKYWEKKAREAAQNAQNEGVSGDL